MGLKRLYSPWIAFRKGIANVLGGQDARVIGGLVVVTAGAGAVLLSAAFLLGLAWRLFVVTAGG